MNGPEDWMLANRRWLAAELRALLGRFEGTPPSGIPAAGEEDSEELASAMTVPPALASVVRAFGLSPFERDLLLLCAGTELDGEVAAAVARASGDPARPWVTTRLALARLPGAHWSALTPEAPLRRWRLVDQEDGAALGAGPSDCPLRAPERVVHHLVGLGYLDPELEGLIELVPGVGASPSHAGAVEAVRGAWVGASAGVSGTLLVQLIGGTAAAPSRAAVAAATQLGLQAAVVAAAAIPASGPDRTRLARLWEREAALGSVLLIVDAAGADDEAVGRAGDLLDRLACPALSVGPRPLPVRRRDTVRIGVEAPGRDERRRLWQAALTDRGMDVDGHLDAVADQFAVGPEDIDRAASELALRGPQQGPEDAGRLLWDMCRLTARAALDGLAERLSNTAALADLVLPAAQQELLREIAVHVRHRSRVHTEWGFAAAGRRGLGTAALFAGPSGTGKTMAAEALGNALGLDVYRVDLSQVVSKYIGETEKNLARVFHAAEGGSAILLFDEADALFGKRSDVRDSHDRYANIEVSYLLQRMEAYEGLAVLTTNLKAALDTAFLRRIRFVVQFPFPDARSRAEIWRGAFPAATPTDGLDPERLAQLNVAGGAIRNIAVGAAFRAAEEGGAVGMAHVLRAARAEAVKLERPLSDAETRGWLEPAVPS